MPDKTYVVAVQCHIAKERCSGYSCERAFHDRTGGFADYPKDGSLRFLPVTCGGCCGKGVLRRLTNLTRRIKKEEGIDKDRVVVHLASCVTKDSFHSPRCMFADYIKTLVARAGLDCREDTHISPVSEKRRQAGIYGSGAAAP